MTSHWWTHADYSCWLSCPGNYSYAWKLFPRLVTPISSQVLRWDWPTCSSLSLLSSSSWRLQWYLLSSSPSAVFPITMISQKLLKWPCRDVSQLPWYSWMHPIRAHGLLYVQFAYKFSDLIIFHPDMFSLLQAFPVVSRAWEPVLLVKVEVKEALNTSGFAISRIRRVPTSFSSGPTFSLAFILWIYPTEALTESPVWILNVSFHG